MERQRAKDFIIAPLLLSAWVVVVDAQAADATGEGALNGMNIPVDTPGGVASGDPFGFDPAELDPIRFTRSDSDDAILAASRNRGLPAYQTEFSFRLKPGRLDFSRQGLYGLGLFGRPQVDVQSGPLGPMGLNDLIPDLNDGLSYSAGVRIEHEDEDINGTAYVSSSLLGLSYGRLGRLWYGGIDVNLEQFADSGAGEDQPDVLSLDLTTGRRLGFTGLSASSPLWMLSLQGDFDVQVDDADDQLHTDSAWYLNPSLFWQHPGFTFSAEMQVPVDVEPATDETEKPDYRLRAVFEKSFK